MPCWCLIRVSNGCYSSQHSPVTIKEMSVIQQEYLLAGMWVREHQISAPLNWHDASDSRRITVFARELVDARHKDADLPALLFLQGGPGGKSPRPTSRGGWLDEALQHFRVILLDQRGTGRSSRIEGAALQKMTPQQGANYLACFRADAIVADAELLRKEDFGGQPWSTLGQSFGGFITLTYLSQAPEGLTACYVTGGLSSLTADADEVYRRTSQRVLQKNQQAFQRYPHLQPLITQVAEYLSQHNVLLPDGDQLTVHRLQTLGLDLGMSEGYERLLWLFEGAFNPDGHLSDGFLAQVMSLTSFAENPLFAALHETIYATGETPATDWAAQRQRDLLSPLSEDQRPINLTGEMIFPWMFSEIRALEPFKAAVDVLASLEQWPALYDVARLRSNKVPVIAAVYFNDMYVDAQLSLETAQQVGNVTTWVTSEYEHNGLRAGNVFTHLRQMARELGLK